MVNQDFESGNSSVKISDGAKGSTVEVKVYARPVPESEDAAQAMQRLLSVGGSVSEDAQIVSDYVKILRNAVPDVQAASSLAAQVHLRTAANVEINGGQIAYDPDQKLMAEWVSQQRQANGGHAEDS